MFEGAKHYAGNFIAGVGPDVDNLIVTLAIGDNAFAVLLLNLPDLLVSIFEFGLFLFRNDHVRNPNRDAGLGRFRKTEFLQFIQRRDRFGRASNLVTTPDNIAKLFLARCLVEKSQLFRPNLVEDDTARCGLDDLCLGISKGRLLAVIGILDPDAIVRPNTSLGHGKFHFGRIRKKRKTSVAVTSYGTSRILCQIITAERDVLGRRRDRLATRWREDVIRSEHEHTGFHLRFHRERHMDSHLVAVEVRVVSRADERVDADGFAFDQLWFKRLDRQSMQSRRPIEQHRMTLGDFVKNVPDFRRLALNHFFRAAHRVHITEIL